MFHFLATKNGRSLLVISLLFILTGWGLSEWGKLRPAKVVIVEGFPEISGLVWLPERQSLIGVSDELLIGELSLQGEVLELHSFPGDLESIIISPDNPGEFLVMDECGARLLWFSNPELDFVREQSLPPEAIIGESCNRRIEGMALHGEDGFVFANEGPATLLFFDSGLNKHREDVSVDAQYISGIVPLYDGSMLLVSRDAGLRMYSSEGQALGPWKRVSEGYIECGLFVPGEGLVLCVDRDPSKLLFFPNIRNDASLKQIFLYP